MFLETELSALNTLQLQHDISFALAEERKGQTARATIPCRI
jgi:hypothetical protein